MKQVRAVCGSSARHVYPDNRSKGNVLVFAAVGADDAKRASCTRLGIESRDLTERNRYRLSGRTGGGLGAQVDFEIALVEITVVGRDAAGLADQRGALHQ